MRSPHLLALVLVSLAGTAAATADDRVAKSPTTFEEAMGRLEKLLGRQSDKDFRQSRFVLDDEVRSSPEPGKPIAIVTKGVMTYGVPVRSGSIITFDQILSSHRSVFDVGEGNQRTLSREVQNHTAVRYTLHRASSGDWFFESVSLSHNIPQFRDRASETGRVNWLPEGIELVGTSSDEFFRQGGQLAPGAVLIRRRLTPQGNRLVEVLTAQTYEFAKGPKGDVLPIPDFSRPFGEEFKTERQSEPLQRDVVNGR